MTSRQLTAIIVTALLVLSAWDVDAQQSRGRLSESQKAALREAKRSASEDAATLARGGDFDGAEAIVADLATAKRETADWHMQMGREFTNIALRLSGKAPAEVLEGTARRGLYHLKRADALTTDVRIRAGALNLSGFLLERFIGDIPAALASYRGVLEVAPASRGTSERISRLEATRKRAEAAAGDVQ